MDTFLGVKTEYSSLKEIKTMIGYVKKILYIDIRFSLVAGLQILKARMLLITNIKGITNIYNKHKYKHTGDQ